MGWIAWIVLGGLAGWVASILTGKGGGIIRNVIVGIIGAFAGTWILGFFGEAKALTFSFTTFLVAVGGAVVFLFLANLLFGRRR